MAQRPRKSSLPESSGHPCAWAGCVLGGDYKAPKSRQSAHEYQWFCLEHVKAFNQNWNYFEGMNEDQIYAFQKDATLGHRPTWKSGTGAPPLEHALEEALRGFWNGEKATQTKLVKPIKARDKDALALLDLEHPVDKATIKKQYRALVKKTHPDVNKGSKQAEELFKKLAKAYDHLIKHYEG
jgi:hypothetical protein